MLKAIAEIIEAYGTQDRAHQTKEAVRGGNTGKEGPIHERLAEIGADERSIQLPSITVEMRGEDAHEGSALLADGGPANVHPRNHQLRRRQTRDIYQANRCTYNACDDRESLGQGGVPRMFALVYSLDEAYPETHGSDEAKESELKAAREREDDLVDAIYIQGST